MRFARKRNEAAADVDKCLKQSYEKLLVSNCNVCLVVVSVS